VRTLFRSSFATLFFYVGTNFFPFPSSPFFLFFPLFCSSTIHQIRQNRQVHANVALFFSLSGDASKDAERRLLLGYAVHREKVRERGGSVKIESHGLKIE